MYILLSIIIIVSALLFAFQPGFRGCSGPGANIGGDIWVFMMMPILLIATNLSGPFAATLITIAQTLFLTIVVVRMCIHESNRKNPKNPGIYKDFPDSCS
jgi:hypothetical protein